MAGFLLLLFCLTRVPGHAFIGTAGLDGKADEVEAFQSEDGSAAMQLRPDMPQLPAVSPFLLDADALLLLRRPGQIGLYDDDLLQLDSVFLECEISVRFP